MVYILVYVGEFGFELFNWQGTIRKFAPTIAPGDRIVCCSRAQVYPLYECADIYLDIGEVETLQRSRATAYIGTPKEQGGLDLAALRFRHRLKRDLTSFILARLRELRQLQEGEEHRFVFSSDGTVLHGCVFGFTGYRVGTLGALTLERRNIGMPRMQ